MNTTSGNWCHVCGDIVTEPDNEHILDHIHTVRHHCNSILKEYNDKKKNFSKNRDGVLIYGNVEEESRPENRIENSDHHKIRIYLKPNQSARFWFNITNDMKKKDLLVVGIHLAHPQPQFLMNDHGYTFDRKEPKVLKNKSSIINEVVINFEASDIGQYEMPIMFTFYNIDEDRKIIFVREMVAMVEENPVEHKPMKSPYTTEEWEKEHIIIKSTNHVPYQVNYKIPKLLKILLPRGLEERALEGLKYAPEIMDQLRLVLLATRALFDEGLSKNTYTQIFHHLLWWEETIARINLRKYNMTDVKLELKADKYFLEVQGLSEKRPSLLRGDRIFLRPKANMKIVFESVVKDTEDNRVQLADIDEEKFNEYYSPDALFDVRFLMSRVPYERMHEAVTRLYNNGQEWRVFPVANAHPRPLKPIERYYNSYIASNPEQRSAVQHIISGTSGRAPYIVFGPPGTGKTMTIVEAIVQLVVSNPKHRILVCTDSNMAADHIALMLLKNNKKLNINNFLLRACSQCREWSVMPAELKPFSNGDSYATFYPISNVHATAYRVVVTTLLHAAKYASASSQAMHKLSMSHLFIDEAAQALEPAALVPLALLAPTARLVLAGDPRQLGPVCISRSAAHHGLGMSLLERLKRDYANMYSDDPNYITMLVKNFRSAPAILELPNELFYEKNLVPMAKPDKLSETNILGLEGGQEAVVFHSVHSREQRMGNSPSYFNEKELEMLKRYIKALVVQHKVDLKDIGVIAPYIRQVYKMKSWLTEENYGDIQVGTVEAFQGKEKRVILVSTVRANCRLLEYDAKYGLGFLVDDKRFNVALTRAKAKLIIIGNSACLAKDSKWQMYMDLCCKLNSYYGRPTEQIPRSVGLLVEISQTRFKTCGMTDALKSKKENNKDGNGNSR